MKHKLLIKLSLAVVGAGLCLAALGLQAITIDMATYGVGTIDPAEPSSPSDELGYAQNMVGVYNGSLTSPIAGHTYTVMQGSLTPSPMLPAVQTGSDNLGANLGPIFSLDLTATPADYLLVKWGGGPVGKDALYYIRGLSGNVTVDNDIVFNTQDRPLGGSHYVLFTAGHNVPDGGLTLALLGFGLSTVAGMRRLMGK